MTEVKINSKSIGKDFGIYIDTSTNDIVAINKKDIPKIEEANKQKDISDTLIIKGYLLAKTDNAYEDNTKRVHEFKIKNLKFPQRITWI